CRRERAARARSGSHAWGGYRAEDPSWFRSGYYIPFWVLLPARNYNDGMTKTSAVHTATGSQRRPLSLMPSFPVLIVGAGPAGLSTAIALARRGVESLIVDRRLKRSTLPRATAVSTRSMELIRSWGLEKAIRAGGVDVEWLMSESPTLA